MIYLAYLPKPDGTEPPGTEGKVTGTALSDRQAIERATKALGQGCVVLACTKGQFSYKDEDWSMIYPMERRRTT